MIMVMTMVMMMTISIVMTKAGVPSTDRVTRCYTRAAPLPLFKGSHSWESQYRRRQWRRRGWWRSRTSCTSTWQLDNHGSLLNSLSVCRQSWDELRFYRDYQKSQTHAFRGNNSEWSQVPRKPQSWFCPDFLSACRPSWDESGCNLILVKVTMMSWSAISFYDLNIMVRMTLNVIFKSCLCAGKVG